MEPMTFNQLTNFLLNQMSALVLYQNQPNYEFIKGQFDQYEIPSEEWLNLDMATAKLLGFQLWEEDSNLMLIPGYLYQFIPAGLELYSISGEKEQYQSYDDLDNDTRYGCLAYGIRFEEQS